ncbi:MAG TPA: TetR/AcrR family transcriptional regulator [Candidatus Angelobacter sp.]|nr:TetR/AcrR family transcriptional regulator [Candidatus Angelobacter sp.]
MPKVVPEYKEEAKSRILGAANKVFAEKGYHEATMDDIAKRLGVSKGAIYLYFASKEDLFEAMCKTAPQAFKEILYSSFSTETDPVRSATQFFDKMLKLSASNPGLGFEILSEASRNPALKRILKQNHAEYEEVLSGFLAEGRKKRFVGDSLDIRPLANSLIALWNGLETLLVAGLPVDEARRAWLEALKAIFMNQHVIHRNPSSRQPNNLSKIE